jgi:hypothetical protein
MLGLVPFHSSVRPSPQAERTQNSLKILIVSTSFPVLLVREDTRAMAAGLCLACHIVYIVTGDHRLPRRRAGRGLSKQI